MRIFFDTEFTGLGQRFPQLISIGFIDELGNSLYLEVEHDESKRTPFVEDEVVPLLSGTPLKPEAASKAANDWLSEFFQNESAIEFVCDFELDAKFLRSLLADGFDGSRMKIVNGRDAFKFVPDEIFDNRSDRHHALSDAVELRRLWNSARSNGFKPS